MINYENKIKFKFKLLASWYDISDIFFLLDSKSHPRKELANKIPNKNIKILDVCIGTANSSIIIAKKNIENHIVGIDLSPDMIAVAENKIRKENIKNIKIFEMNAKDMNFKNEEFDIVMVSYGLHEMDYDLMTSVLKEMNRVLKYNGELYILDLAKDKIWWRDFILKIYLRLFEPKHMKYFLNYDWKSILNESGFTFLDIEKYIFSQIISSRK